MGVFLVAVVVAGAVVAFPGVFFCAIAAVPEINRINVIRIVFFMVVVSLLIQNKAKYVPYICVYNLMLDNKWQNKKSPAFGEGLI
jgi:hypothetical protein